MTRHSLAALAVALALSAPASAASGTIAFASGKVSVTRSGRTVPALKGMALLPGDAVGTGPKSTAIVSLDDGSSLKLRESSQVVLSGARKASLTEVILRLGGVFSRAKPGSGREFRLRTPQAVAAVRGTDFFTAFGPKKGKVQNLWLCVGEGAVEVRSIATKKKVTVKEGEGILIKAGKELTAPQAYEWTRGLNWNMDPGKGAVEDETKFSTAPAKGQ